MSAWNMIESLDFMAFQLRAQTDLEPIPNSFLYINICIGSDLVLLFLFSFIHIVKLSDIHS